jgi:hypothetical protein
VTKICCGPARTVFAVSNDSTACARTTGLFLSGNAGSLSAQLLEASVAQGAIGLCISMEGVALALPPITPQHYAYVPPALRAIPVALIVNAEQAAFLESVAGAAATSGTLRRTFLSHDEAAAWVRQQARALSANRAWWTLRQSRP